MFIVHAPASGYIDEITCSRMYGTPHMSLAGLLEFYRAMLCCERLCYSKSSVRLSVRLSVYTMAGNIHRESKKETLYSCPSLLNIDRFSQFFHRRTQLELCNKIINNDAASPQMCCYTTLWNRSLFSEDMDKSIVSHFLLTHGVILNFLHRQSATPFWWNNNLHKSLKVTKGHVVRQLTYDCLLVVHSNYIFSLPRSFVSNS